MQSFFIPLFLRGLILCFLTALALLLLRRTAAAYRHLVCVLALLVLPLLPWAQQFMPNLRLLPPQRTTALDQGLVSQKGAGRFYSLPRKSDMPASQEFSQETMPGTKPSSLPPTGSGMEGSVAAALPPTPYRNPIKKVTLILFVIWGLGVAALFLRLLVALCRLHKLKIESRNALASHVSIRISEQVQTPLTWGFGTRRSVILLPAALLSGDPAVCDSALRHEQAHIARWDWMWNLLAELVCMFCWFQPGVWWLRSRMRLESERACDDRVLLSGIAGPDYAAHLLEIVRSVRTYEIAPAMAQSQEMEKRMRHILNGAKPRHASIKWLAVAAPFALALLSLAALRVSARPQATKLPDDKGATLNSNVSLSRQATAAGPAEQPGIGGGKNGQQGNGSPAATLSDVSPAITLAHVSWGQAVDGLEPGFLPTPLPNNRRVSFNSQVAYKVLIRNVTHKEHIFEFQCTKYGPSNYVPYLIPKDELRDALRSQSIPSRFRAIAVTDLSLVSSAYTVTLAPGEAAVVPEEFGLYIGDGDKQSSPRVEAIKTGMNWIVQPITIRELTSAEKARFEQLSKSSYASKSLVIVIDRNGKTRQAVAPATGAEAAGKQLYAGIQLEVGTNLDHTLTGHSASVSAEVFSPDSKRLATGSTDGTAIVWEVGGRKMVMLQGRTAAISSIRYAPNGKYLFTGCSDGAIHIWDAATGEPLRSLTGPGGGVCALDVSSDGSKLLGGYENGTVKIWNPFTGQALGTFTYDNRLLSAAISPDGKSIAAGYSDAMLNVWDLPTQQSLISKKIPENRYENNGITGVHFDTQGTLYTWNPDETQSGKLKITVLTMWEVRPRKILGIITFPTPPGAISHAVTYDTLAMAYGLSEGRVVLNNMHDGPVTLDAHEGPVAAVAISPDGALGATGGQRNGKGEAKIWDMQAHKPANPTK